MVIIHTHSLHLYNYNTYMKIIFIRPWCIVHLIFILVQLGLYFGSDYCCKETMKRYVAKKNHNCGFVIHQTSSDRTWMAWAKVTCVAFLEGGREGQRERGGGRERGWMEGERVDGGGEGERERGREMNVRQ